MSVDPPAGKARRLPPLPPGWQPVSHAILENGALALIATDVDLAAAWARTSAARARTSPSSRDLRAPHLLARSARGRCYLLDGSAWSAEPTFPLESPFPYLQRFRTGEWLIVSPRTAEGANARVVRADGSIARRIMLGDGISHVAADAEDRIWVGWMDEGINGNDAWRVPGREWPPSSEGVAVFGPDGAVLPERDWPPGVDSPSDCYALSVPGRGVWVCTYTDFPIVRLIPGRPTRWWRNRLAGSQAIAADGARVLLAGGYGVEANRLTLLELRGVGAGERAEVLATWTLPLRPAGTATEWHVWERPDLLAGRGDTLHLVDDGMWWRWRVADLDTAA